MGKIDFSDSDNWPKEHFVKEAQATVIRDVRFDKEQFWIIAILDWQGNAGGSYIKHTWKDVVSFLNRRARYIAKSRVWRASLNARKVR